MKYSQMLAKLYNLKGSGIDLALLLQRLGNPHHRFKSILVGGTNGKGSTANFISQILQAAGLKVGLFTSPHLIELEERIKINNVMISSAQLLEQFEIIWDKLLKLYGAEAKNKARFFHCITAMALNYFATHQVDMAVLEAGIGGRHDATSVVSPSVSVITNVDFDHTEQLGDTLTKIAWEKAGIIAQDGILVTAEEGEELLEIFAQECQSKGAKLIRVNLNPSLQLIRRSLDEQVFNYQGMKGLVIKLAGNFQIKNAVTAIEAVKALSLGYKISEESIRQGLAEAAWPGRMEAISHNPLIILDGAKNPAGMRALRESLAKIQHRKLILVLGISTRKDILGIIKEIVPKASMVIITQAKYRGADPKELEEAVKLYTRDYLVIDDVEQAIVQALKLAEAQDLICITGSLFLVGEAREYFRDG